ncbi:MAG: hypothetical protein CM1200mP29_08910 [Verrucomicrobiota bacterium]|nr:MAG: hypothetical protein CM1200mP29_08910 [Verrucomicrobiota bacterium]
MRAAALGLARARLAPLAKRKNCPLRHFSRIRSSVGCVFPRTANGWLRSRRARAKTTPLPFGFPTASSLAAPAEDENEVYSFNWISNERMIFQMKDRNNFPNGGLYAVNRDGSKSKVLHPSFKTSREFGSRIFKVMDFSTR